MSKPLLILLYTTIISLLIFPSPAGAESLSSPNFRLKTGSINIGGGLKTNPIFKLTDSLGQTAQSQFDSTGYRLRTGFQFLRNSTPFSFKVNTVSASFNNLIPGSFNQTTTILTVSASGTYGYTVKAIENHPPALTGGSANIPDTSCDPVLPCSISDATPWTSTTAYGFGYNMSGSDYDQTDFADATYFRPFPNNAKGESPVTIMSQHGLNGTSIANVNFRINISPTQTTGAYENSIQYIAIPDF